jgi:uncharacterized protein (TIGR02757 family)
MKDPWHKKYPSMNLKQRLDYHYNAFDKSQISPDPLQFLHLFDDEMDIEVMGIIASVFAYGNVRQIINTLHKILIISENRPYRFVKDFHNKNLKSKIKNLKHRFYTEKDIIMFFSLLSDIYEEFGSLKNLFMKTYLPLDKNIKKSLSGFSYHFIARAEDKSVNGKINPGVKFMFPAPEYGSACKRMNLFLRWMVRKDELDFGLWYEIPADKLIIPVDTHIARICKGLKLTKKKNVSWAMAEEITNNLKKFDPSDPVKYDFAICHIGMRKLSF